MCSQAFPGIDERIRGHFESAHPEYIEEKDLSALIRDVKRGRVPSANAIEPPGPVREPSGNHDMRRKSPVGSSSKPARPRSTSPTPKRSRARPQPAVQDPDFLRRGTQQGKLWSPDGDALPSASRPKQPARSSKPVTQPRRPEPGGGEHDDSLRLIKQPDTRPISQEQLVAEVKGIYAGLMMVESKCIEVDNAQSSQSDTKLNNEQWQALIALHCTLLHEHHDIFLASQHPSASLALKRLASKYAMPARMWRHGIHSFLELLRHRLPNSLEHMLTFIYLAYSMMALLYETVPAFEDTWIEYLGDLGRYRMAIEDEDIRDRGNWTLVSRYWYSKASDKAPTTGRLYHHLAILARPNALRQLFYYTKSLCVPVPFPSAKDSIMTLFDPLLKVSDPPTARPTGSDILFVRAHGIMFSKKRLDSYLPTVNDFLQSLDRHIGTVQDKWLEAGCHVGFANCCALMSYGNEENAIMQCRHERDDEAMETESDSVKLSKDLEDALLLAMGTHEVAFRRWHDPNVLPYTHVVIVFMYYLTRHPSALRSLEDRFPWKLLSLLLNAFLESCREYNIIQSDRFPTETSKEYRPLPEDFGLKGFDFAEPYHPIDFFTKMKVADDEKYHELPLMVQARKQRILWLAYKMARTGAWLTWDENTKRFGVNPKYEKEMDLSGGVYMTNMPGAQLTATSDAMDIDDDIPGDTTSAGV
ncbi:hypothetical protein F5Y17DRAFT_470485 [Xylariaceae sp. FL0594]|nr:hypothetical protein F5Y17DRAFT_470485 [Xylariaceae sp. FL0594]